MSNLRQKVAKLAADRPDLRKHLVPILREAADDELEAGRIWDGEEGPWDAWHPYKHHDGHPPAGADNSPQRAKYNQWYRKNVCPDHPTNCGMKEKK